jgi:hypothetical protein
MKERKILTSNPPATSSPHLNIIRFQDLSLSLHIIAQRYTRDSLFHLPFHSYQRHSVPFIFSPSRAGLSHRKPAIVGTSHHSCHVHGEETPSIRYLFNHTNQMHTFHSILCYTLFLLHVSIYLTPSSGRTYVFLNQKHLPLRNCCL